jgi:hypothetical protein
MVWWPPGMVHQLLDNGLVVPLTTPTCDGLITVHQHNDNMCCLEFPKSDHMMVQVGCTVAGCAYTTPDDRELSEVNFTPSEAAYILEIHMLDCHMMETNTPTPQPSDMVTIPGLTCVATTRCQPPA